MTSPLQSPSTHTGRGGETPPSGPNLPHLPFIRKPTLGQIIAYYKHETTKRINHLRSTPGIPFWQRNYWEHIIRSQPALDRIRTYIDTNPARWDEDQLHPNAPPNPFNQWPSL